MINRKTAGVCCWCSGFHCSVLKASLAWVDASLMQPLLHCCTCGLTYSIWSLVCRSQTQSPPVVCSIIGSLSRQSQSELLWWSWKYRTSKLWIWSRDFWTSPPSQRLNFEPPHCWRLHLWDRCGSPSNTGAHPLWTSHTTRWDFPAETRCFTIFWLYFSRWCPSWYWLSKADSEPLRILRDSYIFLEATGGPIAICCTSHPRLD